MKKGSKVSNKEKKMIKNSSNQKVFRKKYQQNQIKVNLKANLRQIDFLDDFDRQLLEDFIYENYYMDQDNGVYFELDLEDEEISNGLEIENEENNYALITGIEQTGEVQKIEDETENNYAIKTRTEQTSQLQEMEDEEISNVLEIENEENNDIQEMKKKNNYPIKIKVEETEDLYEKKEDEEISSDLKLDKMVIFKTNSKIKKKTSLKANQVFVDLLGMNILLTLDIDQLIFFDQTISSVFKGKLIVVNDGYVTLDPVYIRTSNGKFQKNFIPLSFPINSIVTFVEM